MIRLKSSTVSVCVALGLPGVNCHAVAQAYTQKPICMVVGFAPGGNVDTTARMVAQKLTLALGQSVVVDNRGGASGSIGSELVARSAHDGYTLLVIISTLMISAVTAKNPAYDPIRDFAPISTLTYGPHFVSVNASLPVNTIKELIALARAKPGYINFGSGGVGSLTHLEGEFFKSAADIHIVHVPYKSTSVAFADMLGGQVHLLFSSTVSTLPFVKTGKVKVLAVTASKPLAALPEIPTVAESGLPQFIVDSVAGMLAPAKTPQPILHKLSSEAIRFLKTPDRQQALAAQGAEPSGSTSQEYAAIIIEEMARWWKVVACAGISPQ